MEFVVYILYSKTHDKTYTGFTSSLIQRFYSHNFIATKGYTIKFRPWIVAYLEVYDNKAKAIQREKYLKSGVGRDFITKLKSEGFLSATAD